MGLATAAGLAGWLGSIWKERISRLEAAHAQIDVDLRTRRIEVYKDLWEKTALLPRWPKDEKVTYADLLKFTINLKDWYFMTGGMYLSRTTHDEGYFPLQKELEKVLNKGKDGPLSLENPNDYEAIRDKCSALRSLLARDIQSRREPLSETKT